MTDRAGLLALPLLVLMAVGLTFRASFQEPADFTFVNGTEPTTLDPGLMTGAPEKRVADALFEGLTYLDPQSLRPVPGVAERWEVSPDGLTYVFHLREEARWTDGRPVTAHDFAYAWRRLQMPETGGEYAYIMHGVRYAAALNHYGAEAEALRTSIGEAFAALPAGAIPPKLWSKFLAEHEVVGALRGTKDPVLREALGTTEGVLAADRASIAASLLIEADRRSALADEARARYGIDGGVFARDDRTLVVELVAPIPYFLELTSFYPSYPVPRWVVEAPGNAGDWFLPRKLVSNGPFVLDAWRVGDRIRLRRSETYWGRDAIQLESVDALPVENMTTALNLYLTGDADWLPDYPVDLVDHLKLRPDHYRHASFIAYYYRVNTQRPPLDDPRVRKALALAIDRKSLVDDVLRLGQLPAYHLVPPGVPGYEPPPTAVSHDPKRAAELLAEAGFPGGEGFPEIGILYNTLESHKKVAELISDQMSRSLGIRVKPYNQEWQSYLATMRAGDYDLGRAGWIGDYLDPNTFLDIWVTNGGNNQTGWSHAAYDRLIDAAGNMEAFLRDPFVDQLSDPERGAALIADVERAEDPAARQAAAATLRLALLQEAEKILVHDELPIIPIYFYVRSGLVHPRVKGFYSELTLPDGSKAPNLQSIHPLRGITVGARP